MHVPVRAVTKGPRHHFFGYYDKSPWDATGRYLLALEASFANRPPEASDTATVGVIDLEGGASFIPLAHTHAWNWQQGAMLQWLPGAASTLVFNDCRDGEFVSVILDAVTRAERVLPRPVYAVGRDGSRALSLNFARLHRLRPGYGYAGVPDLRQQDPHPDDDGIHLLDLATGESCLLVSYCQIAHWGRDASMEGRHHWFNHVQVNTDDSRFAFLHRWHRETGNWYTRMFTAGFDGSAIRCVSDHEMVSHYDWRDERCLLAWARRRIAGDHYYLFEDGADRVDPVGTDVLPSDGHCSFSPDRRWVLTDTYPDGAGMRSLLLYEPTTNRRIDIGRFLSLPELSGPFRCDLHPRWSRDGRQVCIDSSHTGERQMYVLDVHEIARGEE